MGNSPPKQEELLEEMSSAGRDPGRLGVYRQADRQLVAESRRNLRPRKCKVLCSQITENFITARWQTAAAALSTVWPPRRSENLRQCVIVICWEKLRIIP